MGWIVREASGVVAMISRIYCGTCKEDTLHQRMVCIHCGNVAANAVPERKRGFNNSKPVRRPYSIAFRGEALSLKQIARREGIAYATLTERFRNGLRGEALVEKVPPMRARPKIRSVA